MLTLEDSKPAVVGGATAVVASLAVNPTVSVGLGALLAIVTKRWTDPEANFLLVGGLMLALTGLGGMAVGSFPGGPVAAIGLVGGAAGATFLWVGRKVNQWALGRIAQFVWTLVNFHSTLVLIVKVALVLPLTFAAGVLGADVPIIGDFAFILYCIAVLAGFYVIDQGKSVLQVRRKVRGNRRRGASVEDVKNAAATAEAAAQKAEEVGAATRDADAEDVKAAASTAKETVSSVRSGTEDGGESADEASESGPGGDARSESASDSESVSTDWLAEPSGPSLVVRNVAAQPKSVRVGCRVEGEKRLADDVRLAAGEAADWDDLPTDSAFEVGIVVDGGPSEGRRFDPETDEIRVVVADGSVEFREDARSETAEAGNAAGDAGSAPEDARSAAGDAGSAPDETGSATGDAGGDAGDAGPEDGDAPEPASAGGSPPSSSSVANEVFGETADAETARDGTADGRSASELATAVRQSPTEQQVVELTTFLDAEAPSEREAAVRGLRRSVKDHPESVVPVVSDLASLLRDESAKTRQEAIVTLQRLAEIRPNAVADVTESVVDALDDDSAKVRTAACRTLEATGTNAGTEKLEELADEDPHKSVQVAAYRALPSVER